MDEPFAALDEISRDALNEDLLRLWREDSLTIVFITFGLSSGWVTPNQVSLVVVVFVAGYLG